MSASGCGRPCAVGPSADLGLRIGAGEGNRTLMTSLEGWGSAIELRPRARREACFAPASIVSVPVTGPSGPTAHLASWEADDERPGRGPSARGRACGAVGYGSVHGMWRSLVSAPALGAGGRRFESGHPDQEVFTLHQLPCSHLGLTGLGRVGVRGLRRRRRILGGSPAAARRALSSCRVFQVVREPSSVRSSRSS